MRLQGVRGAHLSAVASDLGLSRRALFWSEHSCVLPHPPH